MVTGDHAVIRTIDTDDTAALLKLYRAARPLACLLNQLHEFVVPTTDEIVHLVQATDKNKVAAFNVVEDRQGNVRGFCALRVTGQEIYPGRFDIMFFDGDDFSTPLANEVGHFLIEEAFQRKGLRRIVAQCLNSEKTLRAFLVNTGFESNGVQREVLYTGGKWFNLESLSLANPAANAALVS